MKFRSLVCLAVAVLLLSGTLQAQTRESLLKTIGENPGWKAAADPKQFDESNLANLAGKAAPTLQRYGLSGVTVQDWTGADGKIRLTLYEMMDASAAYGLFTLERDLETAGVSPIPLGTEGVRNGSRTIFWQSEYVVKLDGNDKAADSLGHLVSASIFGRSRKPPVSDLLPPNNLVAGSDKYIVDASGLDPKLALDGATLGFDADVELATARYTIDGKNVNLVLFLYPTTQLAKDFIESWNTANANDEPFRRRVGPLIAWVRGSRDADVAKGILDLVGHESKVTWTEPPPDIQIGQVIVTVFTFIGIALLFTFVAGISFGGFRIFMKARYPDRVFDRAQDMEIIQLKLDQGFTRKEIGS